MPITEDIRSQAWINGRCLQEPSRFIKSTQFIIDLANASPWDDPKEMLMKSGVYYSNNAYGIPVLNKVSTVSTRFINDEIDPLYAPFNRSVYICYDFQALQQGTVQGNGPTEDPSMIPIDLSKMGNNVGKLSSYVNEVDCGIYKPFMIDCDLKDDLEDSRQGVDYPLLRDSGNNQVPVEIDGRFTDLMNLPYYNLYFEVRFTIDAGGREVKRYIQIPKTFLSHDPMFDFNLSEPQSILIEYSHLLHDATYKDSGDRLNPSVRRHFYYYRYKPPTDYISNILAHACTYIDYGDITLRLCMVVGEVSPETYNEISNPVPGTLTENKSKVGYVTPWSSMAPVILTLHKPIGVSYEHGFSIHDAKMSPSGTEGVIYNSDKFGDSRLGTGSGNVSNNLGWVVNRITNADYITDTNLNVKLRTQGELTIQSPLDPNTYSDTLILNRNLHNKLGGIWGGMTAAMFNQSCIDYPDGVVPEEE